MARDDVFVTYRKERRENSRRHTGALTVGFAVYDGAHHFGPELGIGPIPMLPKVDLRPSNPGVPLSSLPPSLRGGPRLADVDLLQVDDLGAEKTSAWVLEQLYSIINSRYEAEKAIVVTTNLERDELAAQIGERTVSRLEEMCEIVPLFGRDHRRFEAVDRRDEPPPAADLRLA